MQKVDLNLVLNTNLYIGDNKKFEINSILKEFNLNEPLLILDNYFYKNTIFTITISNIMFFN